MSGHAELEAYVARLRRLPTMLERAASKCAEAVDQAINASLAAGHGPSGQVWAPRKDGKAPLQTAPGRATTTRAAGTTIVTALGPIGFVMAQRGFRGTAPRPVLPNKLTPNLIAALKTPLRDEFNKTMGGGS